MDFSFKITDSGEDMDNGIGNPSPIIGETSKSVKKLIILHLSVIPIGANYGNLYETFKKYGNITEIRMKFEENNEKWDAWIFFTNHEEALKACSAVPEILMFDKTIKGALCEKAPYGLEIYHPDLVAEKAKNNLENLPTQRKTKPPTWLTVTSEGEEFNYFKVRGFLKEQIGLIKPGDVKKFGQNCVLIHARSVNQSIMLSSLQSNNNKMKLTGRPHLNYSYGRGVIFNKDLYEFDEKEILEMCPSQVWKVQKIPRTSMVILYFENPDVPLYLNIENERIPVRQYKQKPLQCFNCFKFGHSSKKCKNVKTCSVCAEKEHGVCLLNPKCINCNKNHNATDKLCEQYKIEEEAVNKANAEYISIGYAKRLLNKGKSYANALNTANENSKNTSSAKTLPTEQKSKAVSSKPTKSVPTITLPTISVPTTSGAVLDKRSVQTVSLPDLSQAESLPDLRELSNLPGTERMFDSNFSPCRKKRERPPSLSPISRTPKVVTTNRFEAIALENESIATEVDIHLPPANAYKDHSPIETEELFPPTGEGKSPPKNDSDLEGTKKNISFKPKTSKQYLTKTHQRKVLINKSHKGKPSFASSNRK